MGKIIASDNVTLGGVIQDPAGDEGFKGGGWVGLIKDNPTLGKLALDEALEAEAWLLGQRSYHWFAARWPSRTGALADRLNGIPKYVVSTTLEQPTWNNSKVLTGDLITSVSTLKEQVDGDIIIPASFQLLQTLIEHELVDELRLKVFPLVLGDGERLFGQASDPKHLRLVDSQNLGGVLSLTYQPVRDAQPPPDDTGIRESCMPKRRIPADRQGRQVSGAFFCQEGKRTVRRKAGNSHGRGPLTTTFPVSAARTCETRPNSVRFSVAGSDRTTLPPAARRDNPDCPVTGARAGSVSEPGASGCRRHGRRGLIPVRPVSTVLRSR